MAERRARDGASTSKRGRFTVGARELRAVRGALERSVARHHGAVRRAAFTAVAAFAVLGPLAALGAVRLEGQLRAREAEERPWRIEERVRAGAAPELASTATLQGKVAPLASRALRYLDTPPALGPGVTVDRTHWAYADEHTGLAKPDGEYRVVVLGDSFSGGRPSFAHFLDEALSARIAPGRSVRVIRLGVEGYNTLDSYGVLLHLAPELEPDLVVYEHYQNDFEGGTWEDVQFRQRYGGCVERCTGPRLPGALRFAVERRSALYKEAVRRAKVAKYQLLLPVMQRAVALPALGPAIGAWARWYHPWLYPEADTPIEYGYHRSILLGMIDLARERDVELAIVRITPFPWLGGDERVEGEERVFRQVEAARPGLVLEESRAYLERRLAQLELPKEALYLDPVEPGIDTHPSALAHLLLAEMLLRERILAGQLPGVPLAADASSLVPLSRGEALALLPAAVVDALGLAAPSR